MLQALDGRVETKADHGDDVGEAGKEDEFAARPEVPRAEGKEEEDGDEDEEGDEVGQLREPLFISILPSVRRDQVVEPNDRLFKGS